MAHHLVILVRPVALAATESGYVRASGTETMSIFVGQTVGEYGIEELIGTGRHGDVFRATELVVKRPVAIRVVRSDLVRRSDDRGRFHDAMYTLSGLHHPGIARVFDSGEQGDQL